MSMFEYLYTFFSAQPTLFIIVVTILGLLVGSFLNVVIYRLPVMMERDWAMYSVEFLRESKDKKELAHLQTAIDHLPPEEKDEDKEMFNLILPPSHCPDCQHKIRPWENIPILSYLFLRGKCSNCGTGIHWRYPTIELVCGIFSYVIVAHYGLTMMTLFGLIFTWSLICLTMIDFDHKLLPDQITLPLLGLGLLINIPGTLVPLTDAVIGAAAGYLSLWSVYWIFKLLRNKEGMGYGDFKLLGALGAWMGWQALPMIIIISSAVGAIVGISLILLKGRDKNIPIPFGPYLAAAGWISLLWGDTLMAQYFP